MKRTTKGAIAVGAATLLLLGGGGTFALWNDATTVTAGTINSGELAFGADAWDDAAWTVNGQAMDDAAFAAFLAVPGDTFEFEATAEVLAKGNNLQFTIIPSDNTTLIDALTALGWTFDDDFEVNVSGAGFDVTANAVGADYNPVSLPTAFELVTFDGVNTGTATATITFSGTYGDNEDADADNGSMNEQLVFNGVAFTLQQVFAK